MIDSRFGLKYSFPHTLVHIVDNSMYTGDTPVTITYDPSLFATIVATGMPMGVDNRIVTITRSDVLNKAFGADTLTTSDIEKYGQACEYPASLISQGVPVKLIRVTPSDATYGIVVIFIDWRIINTKDDKVVEIRLNQAPVENITSAAIDISSFANTERLAKMTFTRLAKDTLDDPLDPEHPWKREVLMTYVSAGRGSAYNDFSIYINKPSFDQQKKYKNAVYNFGTIDTRMSENVEIERFTASLINEATKLSAYGVATQMDTVNVQMKKRLEGSSIMIPYVNESVIKNIYKEWRTFFDAQLIDEKNITSVRLKTYKSIGKLMNVNLFDPIFGKFIYQDQIIDIPFLRVNTIDPDIPKLDNDNIVVVGPTIKEYQKTQSVLSWKFNTSGYFTTTETTPTAVGDFTDVALGSVYDPDTTYYATDDVDDVSKYAIADPLNTSNALVPNETGCPEPENWPTNFYTKDSNGKFVAVDEDTTWDPSSNDTYYVLENITSTTAPKADQIVNIIYQKKLESYFKTLYGVTDANKTEANTNGNIATSGFKTTSVVPGTIYLVNAETCPTIHIVSNINSYTGAVTSMAINKVKRVSEDYKVEDETDTVQISKYFEYVDSTNPTDDQLLTKVNADLAKKDIKLKEKDVIAVGYTNADNVKTFKLLLVSDVEDVENTNYSRINAVYKYGSNIYRYLDYTSHYSGEGIYDILGLYSQTGIDYTTDVDHLYTETAAFDTCTSNAGAFTKIGSLVINDVDMFSDNTKASATYQTEEIANNVYNIAQIIENTYVTTNETGEKTIHLLTLPIYTKNNIRVGTPPTSIDVDDDIIGTMYDVSFTDDTAYLNATSDAAWVKEHSSIEEYLYRYCITGQALNVFKIANTNVYPQKNYYSSQYGISTLSENGGLNVAGGYSGFFDDPKISDIERKLKYSELLVKVFKGDVDPRILSTTRCPAKFLFDAGYNTVLGIKALPYSKPTTEDLVYASTIFTDEEKENYALNQDIVKGKHIYADIDVKQAMYDLMIQRCYQGIPEDKRPVGPGSGLQLYLDSGFADIEVVKKMNSSFQTRFTNPNASWDIGGYVSALNGIRYTYVKRIVDGLFRHCNRFTINKPFVNNYAQVPADEWTEFFPNIDATSWDLEELMYSSGGNSWVLDINGNLKRKSQRTLYREETGTSDLLQENNMRTLSQLIYLLQNQLDSWLLEYVDDGILTSMTESINNIFSNWVGTRVESLNIRFERDLNTDGGDIVVCYVDVTFRGLLLRVPIIVNVNRRTS